MCFSYFFDNSNCNAGMISTGLPPMPCICFNQVGEYINDANYSIWCKIEANILSSYCCYVYFTKMIDLRFIITKPPRIASEGMLRYFEAPNLMGETRHAIIYALIQCSQPIRILHVRYGRLLAPRVCTYLHVL